MKIKSIFLFLIIIMGLLFIYINNKSVTHNQSILKKFEYQENLYEKNKIGNWHLDYPDNPYQEKLSYIKTEKAYLIKSTQEKSEILKKDGWKGSISSPSFILDPKKNYQLVLKMKVNSFPLGQNIMVSLRGPKGKTKSKWETLWNVSQANIWESIYIPIYPSNIDNPKKNEWRITIFSSLAYGAYNVEKPSEILISEDITIFELPKGKELVNLKEINLKKDKTTFESSTRKVDEWGNFYSKNSDGSWKHIFPKLIYRDSNRDNYHSMFATYVEYGFNGVMDIKTPQQIDAALKSGLSNLSLNLNGARNKKTHKIDYPYFETYLQKMLNYINEHNQSNKIIWHNFDNEHHNISDYTFQERLASYIDKNTKDPVTGERQYPIYYLNGKQGLARTYLNNQRKVMDITGSYVGKDVHGSLKNGKKDLEAKLLTQFLTPNQKAPSSVIQLQKHFSTKFIPSLFYGILQGGKALSVWRDGSTWEDNIYDFRDTHWAKAFKDDVSAKLDTLLPLIKAPHITQWSASTNKFPTVRIGTRELNGEKYIILANFSDKDETVNITLHDTSNSMVIDYFTKKHITSIKNHQFTVLLQHHNSGYLILKLLK